MFKRTLIVVLLTVAVASLHGQGGGGGGDQSAGGDMPTARALTPLEQFASHLKLDIKMQGPMVEQVLNEAGREAQPVAEEMIQIRQRWINALLSSKPDDAKAAATAYTAAAAKMTGIETHAFQKIFEPLKPNQQNGAAKAFDILAGFFQPASVRSGRGGGGRRGGGGVQANIAANVGTPQLFAQGRRGGGGGGGASLGPIEKSRLDILEEAFQLTKDHKKTVKTLFDDAHKAAAPVRDQLMKARGGIVAAIQAKKPQPDVDAAVQAYAVEATAMTEAEMTALAKLMQGLEKEQRGNSGAISTAFFLMRNMFLDKKWDDVPGTKGY